MENNPTPCYKCVHRYWDSCYPWNSEESYYCTRKPKSKNQITGQVEYDTCIQVRKNLGDMPCSGYITSEEIEENEKRARKEKIRNFFKKLLS